MPPRLAVFETQGAGVVAHVRGSQTFRRVRPIWLVPRSLHRYYGSGDQNPVKRGLVLEPDQWRWSSFRSYFCGEIGLVRINDCGVLQMSERELREEKSSVPRRAPCVSKTARRGGTLEPEVRNRQSYTEPRSGAPAIFRMWSERGASSQIVAALAPWGLQEMYLWAVSTVAFVVP